MIESASIIVSKPKKQDNNYICPIYFACEESKKKKLEHSFTNSILIDIKRTKTNENFIYIKSKHNNNYMFDLNEIIIDIVKDKSQQWFNNNMNVDLIDDYYTNTIVYNKQYGDIIKLKIIDDNFDILKEHLLKKIDIGIVFEHIKFYKQKFVVECTINNINFDDISDTIENESIHSEQDIDIPSPSNEDILNIKSEYLLKLDNFINTQQEQLNIIQDKISEYQEYKELLNNSELNTIISICDKIENLCA